jgi:hypothetical protein
LTLEAGGVAAILSSIGGAVLAVIALPLYLFWAIELEERHLMATRPRMGVEFERSHRPALILPVRAAGLLAIGPAVAYLLAALLTREISVFESGVDVARTLLLGLAGAQGTLAVVGLTAWFVTVELVTSSYSAQVIPRMWSRGTVTAAILLVASILYDVVVVARSDVLLVGHPTRTGVLVDLGLLIAGVAIGATMLSTLSGVRMALPEQVMANLMRRLDDDWLRRIREEFEDSPRTLYPDDPLRGAESLLRALVDRHDVGSFAIAVRLLGYRFQRTLEKEDLIALDVYLHHHLRPLISYVGDRRDCHVMGELMNLADIIEQPPAEVVMRQKLGLFGVPPGERLLRTITDAATSTNCEDAAQRGLWRLAERGRALMTHLPPQTETSVYNPDYDYSRKRTKQEQQRQWDNNSKVRLIQDRYIGYFASTAKRAIQSDCGGAVWAACDNLVDTIGQAVQIRESPRIRQVLIGRALTYLEEVVKAMCEAGRADRLDMGKLEYAARSLKDDDPDASKIVDWICTVVARVLERLAKAGLLQYGPVVEAALLGLEAKNRGSGARIIVDAMGNSIRHLKAFADREDVPFVIKELQGRIEQVGFQSGAKDARELANELRAEWAPDSAVSE